MNEPTPWQQLPSAGSPTNNYATLPFQVLSNTPETGEVFYIADLTGAGGLAPNSTDALWFRLAVGVANTGAAAVSSADVEVEAFYNQLLTGSYSHTFDFQADSGSTYLEVLTPWIPARYVAKVKAAMFASARFSGTATFTAKLVQQTAFTTPDNPIPSVGFLPVGSGNNNYGPTDWTQVGSFNLLAIGAGGAGNVNGETGVTTSTLIDTAPTTTGYAGVRFAVQYSVTAGNVYGQASVHLCSRI